MLSAVVLASALIELTPGPNMGYLTVVSSTEGRRNGFAAVAGVALGLMTVGLLAAVGLAAAIAASPILFAGLRWGGVAYLVWMAWDAWGDETPEEESRQPSAWRYFRRGLITNLLNPKAGVFYIAMLPRFVESSGSVMAQTLTLSVVFVVIATAIHATIVLLAGFAQPFLADPVRRRPVRKVMALALLGIAVWFGWSTGRGS